MEHACPARTIDGELGRKSVPTELPKFFVAKLKGCQVVDYAKILATSSRREGEHIRAQVENDSGLWFVAASAKDP